MTEQHPHQLQQHPHQLDVDLPNGLKINGAMMKTITLTATGMEALVVTMLLEDGTHTAQVFYHLYTNTHSSQDIIKPFWNYNRTILLMNFTIVYFFAK